MIYERPFRPWNLSVNDHVPLTSPYRSSFILVGIHRSTNRNRMREIGKGRKREEAVFPSREGKLSLNKAGAR